MDLIPLYDESQPITCTIGAEEVPDHLELIERMHRSLTAIERTEHGLLLHFPVGDDVAADLREFAVFEKGCCAFWGFDVQHDDDEIRLRWDGPPSIAAYMDTLLGHFEGDQPLTEIPGLL
jgi:hypothetical protein